MAGSRAVKTEMRNVNFHLTNEAAAHLETLSGELVPIGKYAMPVFDNKASFEVRVVNGTISISPQALTSIMNNYVFAKKDSPLKDLSVSIDKDQLIIKGKLATKGIPFETAGTLSATSDGRIRVHTDKVKALHVSVKGMMGLFGIDLANVVNTSKIEGMDTDKNDLLMDLGKLLPPPHIQGKLADVKVANNSIITIFGDGGQSVRDLRGKRQLHGVPRKQGRVRKNGNGRYGSCRRRSRSRRSTGLESVPLQGPARGGLFENYTQLRVARLRERLFETAEVVVRRTGPGSANSPKN